MDIKLKPIFLFLWIVSQLWETHLLLYLLKIICIITTILCLYYSKNLIVFYFYEAFLKVSFFRSTLAAAALTCLFDQSYNDEP